MSCSAKFRQRGGVTPLPPSYFTPTSLASSVTAALPPLPSIPSPSSILGSSSIRDPMVSTFPSQLGGAKSVRMTKKVKRELAKRTGQVKTLARKMKAKTIKAMKTMKTMKTKQKGGFSPSIMGPFLKNVEALAAPVSIYLAYKLLKGEMGKKSGKSRKSKRSRKH